MYDEILVTVDKDKPQRLVGSSFPTWICTNARTVASYRMDPQLASLWRSIRTRAETDVGTDSPQAEEMS